MIRKEILENQALKAHALFWDDPHRDLTRATGTYYDLPKGVEVLENGDVKFAYNAPDAKKVQVAGTGGSFPDTPIDMEKGEDGWWRVTVSGLESAFHFVNFYVDGTRALNPYMPYGYGYSRVMNFFELPDKYSDFYLFHDDIPHGSVRMNYFYSETVGDWRTCWVYTPPKYEQNRGKRYPVFYLQHGGGEAESCWIWQGKINNIMDNLLADGQCEEMIVVLNCGYVYRKDGVIGANPVASPVEDLIANDCVPFIDKKYRTIADRHHRAVSGFSMGGGQTMNTVIKYPEVFANAGVLSAPGIRSDREDKLGLLSDPKKFNENFDLFFVNAGAYEPAGPALKKQTREMREQGYKIVYFESPGYHEWAPWRYGVAEFVKRLFK
jgi:enterochelin esterase-like enzyme